MVDATWVYFANGNALWRARKDGTSEVREKLGPNGMRSLTPAIGQDAERVYWVDERRVLAVSKSTLEVSTYDFESMYLGGGSLLVDDGVAYVAESNCARIARVPLDGAPAQLWEIPIAKSGGGSTALVTDAEFLYCGSGFTDTVVRVDRETGHTEQFVAPTPVLPKLSGIGGLALDATHLYWVEQVTHPDYGPIHLYRADKLEGTPERLMVLPTGTTNHTLVLVGSRLYWESGGLQRYDLEQRQYRYLTQFLTPTQDFAIDEGYVYWTKPGYVFRVKLETLEAAPQLPYLVETRQVPKDLPASDAGQPTATEAGAR